MDLDFTDEQEMLRETVRGVCEKHASLAVVREVEDDPIGYPDSFWTQLADLGLLGLTIPEEYDGSAMSMLDAAVVYEEFGRALAPSPHFVSSVLCGGVLERAGDDMQRGQWLPRIASGEDILTPAWLEPDGGFGPRGVQLRAETDGNSFVLSGTKRHVRFAKAAEAFIVLARTGPTPSDVDLFVVHHDATGITLTQQMTIASDTQYRVDFDSVRVPASARIGAAGSGWDTWDATMRDGIILLAAFAMGGASYALDITVQYAKDRHQFDKPLGAFQALAHYLADAKCAVDGGRTLVWEAAWARDSRRPTDRLAPMAKLFATQTFRDVTAMAQQIFGGVGFTVDYDIQLYFRRAKALQLDWWDTRYLEELVAASVLEA
ncbi:MAG: acyl-CoA dehydrogenase family protein [Acidimicrobiia bacterium]